MPDVGLILASVALVGLSACFSGLTLGLLSLSLESLELIVSGGSAREAAWDAACRPPIPPLGCVFLSFFLQPGPEIAQRQSRNTVPPQAGRQPLSLVTLEASYGAGDG